MIGTLNDEDIAAAISNGDLISENFEPKNIKQACYELRLGDIYFDITENNKRISTNVNGNAIIKPGHLVVLITKEKLNIPNNIFARLISKGSLFSLGLMPVSTYADPGFKGNIGIVTYNLSKNYIVLPVGEPISKIEFSKLSEPVLNPYTGQHGFETSVWPIKSHLIKSYEDVKDDSRVYDLKKEANLALPIAFSESLRSLLTSQRNLNHVIGFISILVIIFIVSNQIPEVTKSIWFAIIAGLAANLLSNIITNKIEKQK